MSARQSMVVQRFVNGPLAMSLHAALSLTAQAWHMVGFALPKLRWLVLGAMAAGGWAMLQEPPKRDHWQRRTALEDAAERTGPRVAPVDPAPIASSPRVQETPPAAIAPSPLSSSVKATQTAQPATQAGRTTLYASEKVRMRKDPSLASSVVTTLKAAQAVTVVGAQGEWRKVNVGGRSGWVRADYLAASAAPPKRDNLITAAVPRPKVDVGTTDTQNAAASPMSQSIAQVINGRPQDAQIPAKPVSSSSTGWGALRPARPPQSGDCQCPYDVMLSGKQCGDHSAYVRRGQSGAACYF